jgi:hypothetical protein
MLEVKVIKNFLPEYDIQWLQAYYQNADKSKLIWDEQFGRYYSSNDRVGSQLLEYKTAEAREIFNSPTLLPTFCCFVEYSGPQARLHKHKDSNACTYTLDLCIYQTEPWDLWVDGKAYTLQENEALAYYGEDQDHWREDFPNPENQKVGLIFLHYAEPDHKFFKLRHNH